MDAVINEREADIQFVHRGRDDFFISACKMSALPVAGVQENANGSYLCATGIQLATCNGVIGNNTPSDSEIDAAIDFFTKRSLPFMWWTESDRLERKGFQFGGQLTGVAAKLDSIRGSESTEICVVPVKDKESLKTFSKILVDGSGIPGGIDRQFYDVFAQGLSDTSYCHFLAYYHQEPVGTITLSLSDVAAGLWNLATLPNWRKKGIGTALVASALQEAKRQEYKEVMAILMPKGLAWNLMASLGFRKVCHFPFYVHGQAADALEQ